MNRDSWFLTLVAILGAYNAGVVWLAQISGYPLWTDELADKRCGEKWSSDAVGRGRVKVLT